MKILFDSIDAWLNSHAGLLSLGAFLAAVFIPILIYRKQKRDHYRELQNEYEAMNEHPHWCMTADDRARYTKKRTLEKNLKKDL